MRRKKEMERKVAQDALNQRKAAKGAGLLSSGPAFGPMTYQDFLASTGGGMGGGLLNQEDEQGLNQLLSSLGMNEPDPMDVYGPATYDQMYPPVDEFQQILDGPRDFARNYQRQTAGMLGAIAHLPESQWRERMGRPPLVGQEPYTPEQRQATEDALRFLPPDMVDEIQSFRAPRIGPQTFMEYANEQYPGSNLPPGTDPRLLQHLVRRSQTMPAIDQFLQMLNQVPNIDPNFNFANTMDATTPARWGLPGYQNAPGADNSQWQNLYQPYSLTGTNPYMLPDADLRGDALRVLVGGFAPHPAAEPQLNNDGMWFGFPGAQQGGL